MKAARIHSFGPPGVVVVEEVPVPSPGPGEILVRVMAAGVAPWDALIREGKSKVSPQPPLTLGSDHSGIIEKVGPGVSDFAPADEVYGVTNPQFCGAQAELAVASAGMVARKPQSLNFLRRSSIGSRHSAAVTAWQNALPVRTGDARTNGNGSSEPPGTSELPLRRTNGRRRRDPRRRYRPPRRPVPATFPGCEIHHRLQQARIRAEPTTGGCRRRHRRGQYVAGLGRSVETRRQTRHFGFHAAACPQGPIFFYAEVTTARLQTLTTLFDAGRITARVGSILPLTQARQAQDMLAGAPHKPGKIVLQIGHPQQ